MFRRSLFATALAGTIALTSVAATPAVAAPDAEDYIKTILGIAILGAIADAARDQDRRRDTVSRRSDRYDDYRGHRDDRRHRLQALPARCEFEVRTSRGWRDVFGRHCLRREGFRTERLPERCEFEVRARGRERTVYGKYCLERAGYRVEARRRR